MSKDEARDEPMRHDDAILHYLKHGIWPEIAEADDGEMCMIERMARALCVRTGLDPDYKGRIDGADFHWQEFVKDAVAALEAMRKPSGCMTGDAHDTIVYGRRHLSEIQLAGEVWEKMIDVALLGG